MFVFFAVFARRVAHNSHCNFLLSDYNEKKTYIRDNSKQQLGRKKRSYHPQHVLVCKHRGKQTLVIAND